MRPIKIIFAFLYDLLLLLAVWFVTAIPFVLWQGESLQTNTNSMIGFQVYLLAITYVYLTYFWTLNGQSPGLRVWKLKIRRVDGYLMTRHNANVRFILGILIFPFGWIYLLFPKSTQTLQDKLSGTEIVPQDQ